MAVLQGVFSDVGGITGFVDQLTAAGMIADREGMPIGAEPRPPSGAPEPLTVERFDDMADMIRLDPVRDVDRDAGWPRPNDA